MQFSFKNVRKTPKKEDENKRATDTNGHKMDGKVFLPSTIEIRKYNFNLFLVFFTLSHTQNWTNSHCYFMIPSVRFILSFGWKCVWYKDALSNDRYVLWLIRCLLDWILFYFFWCYSLWTSNSCCWYHLAIPLGFIAIGSVVPTQNKERERTKLWLIKMYLYIQKHWCIDNKLFLPFSSVVVSASVYCLIWLNFFFLISNQQLAFFEAFDSILSNFFFFLSFSLFSLRKVKRDWTRYII